MPKDDAVYVHHMLDKAREALTLLGSRDRRGFDRDLALRLALTHLIQTIGEAARRLSEPFCAAHPHVPWTQIVGMRHKIVHDYLDVDEDVVWSVVSVDLPALVLELEEIVAAAAPRP